MKLPAFLLLIAWPAAVLAADGSPIASGNPAADQSPAAVAAARERGAATAGKDIKAGMLRVLYYGKPWSADKPLVDDATGYRVQIVSGCAVTEALVAEVDAYNRKMRDHYAASGGLVRPK